MTSCPPFFHPHALVEPGAIVGDGTRVWAFAHILPGAKVGAGCNICDHTFIESGATLGDRVTVKCGVYLWTGFVAEDDVFIGPAVAFTNDLRPRSRQHPGQYRSVVLRQGCSLGAGSSILPVNIGRWAIIGAGAVVTKDVPDHALVVGNPGRFRAWVCRCARNLDLPGVSSRVTCECGRRYYWVSQSKVEEETL